MNTGERLWRPVSNDSGKLEFSFFNMEQCDGFGLLQRDRRLSAYEDGEAAYHLRPSLWIEPTSDWGPGRDMLMEIPTANELADNTVAMWEPAEVPQPGDRIEFPTASTGRRMRTPHKRADTWWRPYQKTSSPSYSTLPPQC